MPRRASAPTTLPAASVATVISATANANVAASTASPSDSSPLPSSQPGSSSASISNAGGATRPRRIMPSRSRRGGPGVGISDVDTQILETLRRRRENDPLIPAHTQLLLTTNSTRGSQLNTSAYERYFDKPEVIRAYREQQLIQTPEYTLLSEHEAVGGRFRPRGLDDEGIDTSDAAYEKRHRKYETFEKRQRLREKEKLKHEQYKLKERIEQLRALEPSAFLHVADSFFAGSFTTLRANANANAAPAQVHCDGEWRKRQILGRREQPRGSLPHSTRHCTPRRFRAHSPPSSHYPNQLRSSSSTATARSNRQSQSRSSRPSNRLPPHAETRTRPSGCVSSSRHARHRPSYHPQNHYLYLYLHQRETQQHQARTRAMEQPARARPYPSLHLPHQHPLCHIPFPPATTTTTTIGTDMAASATHLTLRRRPARAAAAHLKPVGPVTATTTAPAAPSPPAPPPAQAHGPKRPRKRRRVELSDDVLSPVADAAGVEVEEEQEEEQEQEPDSGEEGEDEEGDEDEEDRRERWRECALYREAQRHTHRHLGIFGLRGFPADIEHMRDFVPPAWALPSDDLHATSAVPVAARGVGTEADPNAVEVEETLLEVESDMSDRLTNVETPRTVDSQETEDMMLPC
ncbi:hypothetical protein H4582DRAFT_1909484 [Lactarius indigo]|nr:hypothetical protein H4582DRAFT_1909484 [Lactarius indigo]